MVLADKALAVHDLHHLLRPRMERIEDPHLERRTPGIVTLSRPVPAKLICVSPWPRRSFAPAPGGASSTWSIWSIGLRPRHVMDGGTFSSSLHPRFLPQVGN